MENTRRVMEKEDLARLEWLQGAKLSPDGKRAVYAVSYISEKDDEEKEFVSLYLVDVESGESRRLTEGKKRDSSPDWSPDGKALAFVSDREEKPQLFVLPVHGGEARQLTDLKQGIGNPKWSPDGTKISFTAGIDYGEDEAPDRAKEPYRVTRNVWRFDLIGDLELAVNNIYVLDVDGDELSQLTDMATVNSELRWSPDGSRILFAAAMRPETHEAFFPVYHVVDLEGNVEAIAAEWGNSWMGEWLGDGRRVAFVGLPDDGAPIGTQDGLWVHDLENGTFEERAPSLDFSIGGGLEGRLPAASLAAPYIGVVGNQAYVRVQAGGTVQIFRMALEGDEEAEAVVSGERACMLLHVAGGRLLFSADSIDATPDLYVCNLDGSDERRLTQINEPFMSEIARPEHVHLQFAGQDGTGVEGWYVKPTDRTEAPYPTILWIHGGPHYAQGHRFAFDTHVLAGAGYGVLFVNHRASTGYGDTFATAIKGDWGNLDYGDLMAGVDFAIERGLADPERMGVCGISGGGNLSCWTVGQTGRFKAAVPQNPVTNWVSFYGVSDIGVYFSTEELGGHPHEIPDVYRRCSPITYAHQCVTPTLLIQTEHDWRCPPEQSEQFYTVLKANGCTVEMLRQPAGSHGGSIMGPVPLRKANLEAKLDWFDRHVMGEDT